MKIKDWLRKYYIWILVFTLILILLGGIFYLIYPKIYLQGNNPEVVGLNSDYEESGYYYRYLFDKGDEEISVSGNVDTSKVGVYKITYQLKKGFFTAKKTRVVKVVDLDSPVISLVGDSSVKVCPNKKYEEEGYSAMDAYDGDLTDKVKVNLMDDRVVYTVKDSSMNEGKAERFITYVDDTLPVITLKGSAEEVILVGSTYVEDGYVAIDNCDDDVTPLVEVTGSVDTSKVGTYTLTYRVTDKAGNVGETNRTVRVQKERTCTPASSGGQPGVIYLTFDDGPSLQTTSTVLDILKEEGVSATFFVLDHGGTDDLLRRIVNEGHSIGLHTATHNFNKIYKSEDDFFNDLYTIQNKVRNVTGVTSYLMRFPGGVSNTVSRFNPGIMCRLSQEVLQKGFHYFDWNVSAGDAGGTTLASGVYNSVINGLSKNRSNVVLMHDIKPWTRDALRDIIRYGKNNGYTFDKITMDTSMVRHKVAN